MIIDIDAGNTALKWRLSDGRPARRVLLAELAQVAEALQGQPVTGVRVSCVAGESVKQRLSDWAAQHWGVVARFAQPEKNFAGLKVAYAQPVRLGVDRWLAMLAARQRCAGAVCVIDCGSAITVDRVAADGVHLGGYIIPGLRMMRASLRGGTGQIVLADGQPDYRTAWGQSTEGAVNFGTYRAAVSFIESVCEESQRKGWGGHVFLTGGDAEVLRLGLEPQQRQKLILVPDLVLEGLPVALP